MVLPSREMLSAIEAALGALRHLPEDRRILEQGVDIRFEIRNALVRSADPAVITDGSRRIDQGSGFVDIPSALAALSGERMYHDGFDTDDGRRRWRSRHDRDDEPHHVGSRGRSVAGNLERLGFEPVEFTHDRFSARVRNLLPGQVKQFFVPSDDETDRIRRSAHESRQCNFRGADR